MMAKESKYSAVIVAGGKGLRAGGDMPKQFQSVRGIPILMRTINQFYLFDNSIEIVVVLPEGYHDFWIELCEQHNFTVKHMLAVGGETRFHSVRNGLLKVNKDSIVAIHDAARPFVPIDVIKRCYNEAESFQCGVIPVIEEKNSVRVMHGYDSLSFDRSKLRIVQTPQTFPASLILNAYDLPFSSSYTDDASVADAAGIQIKLVEGDEVNIKITTPYDLKIAEFLVGL